MGGEDRTIEVLREIAKKIKIFFKIFKIWGGVEIFTTISVK